MLLEADLSEIMSSSGAGIVSTTTLVLAPENVGSSVTVTEVPRVGTSDGLMSWEVKLTLSLPPLSYALIKNVPERNGTGTLVAGRPTLVTTTSEVPQVKPEDRVLYLI